MGSLCRDNFEIGLLGGSACVHCFGAHCNKMYSVNEMSLRSCRYHKSNDQNVRQTGRAKSRTNRFATKLAGCHHHKPRTNRSSTKLAGSHSCRILEYVRTARTNRPATKLVGIHSYRYCTPVPLPTVPTVSTQDQPNIFLRPSHIEFVFHEDTVQRMDCVQPALIHEGAIMSGRSTSGLLKLLLMAEIDI
jgi:hypothetical protein